MQRYESYKPSGVKWLVDIPAHWEVRPGFTCFKENKDRNKGLVENTVLSLSYGRIVIKPEEKLTGLVPESFESYQLIKPGDIVIRTTDLQNDQTSLRVGYAKDKGMITSAYLGLRCHPEINPEYVFRLLESYDALKVFYGMGSGLRQNIDFWDFKRLPIPLPPRDEQDRIVAFLDQKTAEINAAIAKKVRLIELLKEQIGLIQTRVISHGLNQQESQKNWRTVPLKWFIKIGSGDFLPGEKMTSEPDQLRSVPVIGGNGVMGYTAVPNTKVRVIAVGRVGALCGNVHPIEIPAWITDNALRITCSGEFDFSYMVAALRSLNLNRLANKNAQPLITGSMIKDQTVSLPPFDEQVAISKFLANAEATTNQTCQSVEGEIKQLLELRSIVISHAVMGMVRI